MTTTFLIELPDGTLARKTRLEFEPEDRVVIDGPEAFAAVLAAEQALEAEIEAAGGIARWREGEG